MFLEVYLNLAPRKLQFAIDRDIAVAFGSTSP